MTQVRDERGTEDELFIEKAQDRQKLAHDKNMKAEAKKLKIGDKVLLWKNTVEQNWSAKLEPKWEGPKTCPQNSTKAIHNPTKPTQETMTNFIMEIPSFTEEIAQKVHQSLKDYWNGEVIYHLYSDDVSPLATFN